jgi:hypothetical protein
MDEAMFMYMAQCSRQTGGDVQEPSHLHRLAEEAGERLAPGVLKQQHGLPALAHKCQWLHRPRAVHLGFQCVLVSQPIGEAWRGVFRGGQHGQHGGPDAIPVIAPSSAEEALTFLVQDRKAPSSARSR